MYRRNLITITSALMIAAVLSYAAVAIGDTFSSPGGVPRLIPFRGRLDQGGVAVTTSVTASFSLFDAPVGGARLWGPEVHDLTPADGNFTVLLGETVPLPAAAFAGGDTFVEVTVGSSTLVGRQRLLSTAYSVRSLDADNGVPMGGMMLWDGPSCPEGWLQEDAYGGRFLVFAPSGGTVGGTVGTALTDRQDRALPTHAHSMSASTGYPSRADCYWNGVGWADGHFVEDTTVDERGCLHTHSISGTIGAASSGTTSAVAPYAQLLLCRRSR